MWLNFIMNAVLIPHETRMIQLTAMFSPVQGSESKSQEENLPILQHVAHVFFITNFGINFVLYCVSGQNFRRAFCSLCCSCSCCPAGSRRRSDGSQVTGESFCWLWV